MTLHLHLISHTHWDREWHLPFQQFRLRLVHLMDGLLELLDSDPEYKHFMLDGQTIVLDDYLQIRPEREGEIRARVEEGRLLIGPWHILPDEFLVSPEATLRNLLEGERTARRFGRKMQVGYIPDPFGHIGQLPQILSGFGLESACLQRGLSDEPTELWWQAPDGSRVFLAYLRDGYGNAAALPTHDPERFLSEVERLANSLLPHSQSSHLRESGEGHLLLMQGTDHMEPPTSTSTALASVSGKLDSISIEHSTLPRYMKVIQAALKESQETLPTVIGELRSSKRHPILPGVMSARIWIKQRNQACETLLEKWAEPFGVWAELAGKEPPAPEPTEGAFFSRLRVGNTAGLLRQAWRILMECHPHDSICGCSVDQVHEEMRPRFDQVEQIGEEITKQSLEALARAANTLPPESLLKAGVRTPSQAIAVFNPGSGLRTDWVQIDLQLHPGEEDFEIVDEDGSVLPHQILDTTSRELMNATMDRDGLLSVLSLAGDGRVASMAVRRVSIHRDKDHLLIEANLAETGGPDLPAWNKAASELQALLNDPTITTFTVKVRTIPETKAIFSAPEIPGPGYRIFWIRPIQQPDRIEEVTGLETTIANEYLSLSFSDKDATFSLHDLRSGAVYAGLNQFIDGGDCGDEYNYAPPLKDKLIDEIKVKAVRTNTGPVQQSIEVDLEMIIPEELAEGRTSRNERNLPLSIQTRATLTQKVSRVDFMTTVENLARDHRLRVHFKVPFKAIHAEHDGHFEIVNRPIGVAEFDSTWIEEPRPEVPQRVFTRLSNGGLALALANRGLPEIEARQTESQNEQELALTLLRCVGWLSRDDFSTRKGHAGPMLATPGAQMAGKYTFEYALIPDNNSSPVEHYKQAYAFAAPFRAISTELHEGGMPPKTALVEVSEPAFDISAIKFAELDGRSLIVRGYNLTGDSLEVRLEPWKTFARAEKVMLSEQTQSSLTLDEHGGVRIPVGGHEIVTVKFATG